MNTDFPRILSLLRKERGLSQKQVAKDFGISQALLSHYEKGVRECGLDFITKCADYYDVSCDYLLGRTPNKTGAKLIFDDIPDESSCGKENKFKGSLLPILNKRLIFNSLNIIFDLLQKIGNKGLVSEISLYLMTSVYKVFRIIYSCNKKNPQDMFSINEDTYNVFVGSLQNIAELNSRCIISGKSIDGIDKITNEQKINLSPSILNSDYSKFAPSLYNVVQNVESKIPTKKLTKL